MKTIRAKENNEKIIIKLKLNFDLWLLIPIMLLTLSALVYFTVTISENLIWGVIFACGFAIEIFFFYSWIWRGITVNKQKKTITIYSFSMKKLSFNEISLCRVQLYKCEDTNNDSDYYPHLLFYKKSNNRPIKFRTRDKEQAEEIMSYLSQILQY